MAYLSRDEILTRDDFLYEEVKVPEWGGSVRVRGMSATEAERFASGMVDRLGGDAQAEDVQSSRIVGARAKVCASCIVDEKGARVFTDEDVEALGSKSPKALDRVFEVAMRLSGMGEEAAEDAGKG